MSARLLRRRLLPLVLLFLMPGQVLADAAGVLNERDLDKKGIAVVRLRRSMDIQTLLEIARKEKENSIVELALGNYLEGAKPSAQEAAAAVAACAMRRGMFESVAAMAAVNTQMSDLVAQFTGDGRANTDKTRALAAMILACYGRASDVPEPRFPNKEMEDGAPPPDPKKNKKKAGNAVSKLTKPDMAGVTKALKVLLDDRDETTVELAIVAAALLKVKDVQEQIDALKVNGSPQWEAARLFYRARIGVALDADEVATVFARRARPSRFFIKMSPLMSMYDPRSPALGYACHAIGEAGDAKLLDHVHKTLAQDKDLRVQVDAVRAMEMVGSADSVEHLIKALPDAPWPVKVAICSAMGAIPDARSIEPLINQLAEEQGRFRLDVNYALASITDGQKGTDSEGWRAWWGTAQSTFKVDPKKTAAFRAAHRVQDMNVAPLGSFYDTSIFSDRVAFVLDTSASMRGDKFASLKENMAQTMRGLKPYVHFNVIDFGGHVQTMLPGRLLPAAQVKADTVRAVEYMKLTLGTRTYDGMEAAYQLPALDTIIFLSDGAPVGSKINAWSRIMFMTHVYNRYRPIAVYTVEFEASAANLLALREMAARFAGISGKPQN